MADLLDSNGQPLAVDDHVEADKLLRSGQATLDPRKPVNLVGEDGSVFNVDAKDAGQFLTSGGYRLAHAQEVGADLERQKYSTTGQKLLTGVEGAASGATMGLFDVAGKALSDDWAAESLKREQYNPLSRALGEGAGIVGAAMLSGGTGSVGAAAKLTPAAMAVRAGESAGAAVKAAETASVAVKATRAVAQFAVDGAVQGALFGASKAVRDDYMRDHEITAERIAMGAGEGLLDGLKFGAAEGSVAAVGMLGKAAAKGLYGKFMAGAGDDVAAGVANATSKRGVTEHLDDYAAGVTAKDRFKEAHAAATREVTDLADHSAELWDEVQAHMNIGFKPDAVKNALVKAPPADLAAMTGDLTEQGVNLMTRFDLELAKGTDVYNDAGIRLLKKAQKELDVFDSRFTKGARAGGIDGATDQLIAFDKFKRFLGNLQDSAGSGIHGDPAAVEYLKREYMQLRGMLEDSKMLGDGFTAMQRETNKAMTDYIPLAKAFEAEASLGKNLRTRRNVYDGFQMTRDADPRKIGAILNDVGGPTNYKSEEFLTKAPRLQADMAETMAKYYDLPGNHSQTVKTLKENAEKISGKLEELRTIKGEADAYAQSQDTLKGLGPLIGGTVAGAREASQRLASATSAILSGSSEQATIAGKLHKAAVAAADRAERVVESAAKALTSVKRGAMAAPGAAAFMGAKYDPKDPSKFAEHLTDIQENGKINRALAGLRQVSPEMADAQTAQVVRTAKFLAEKTAPRNPQRPTVFSAAQKPQPAQPTEALKAQRYVDAAVKPDKALERVKAGSYTPEDLETLQALYPRMYQRLRTQVLAELPNMRDVPSGHTQRILSEVTGMPVNRISDPAYIAQIQQIIKTAPTNSALAQQQQGGQAPHSGATSPQVTAQYATQFGDGGLGGM